MLVDVEVGIDYGHGGALLHERRAVGCTCSGGVVGVEVDAEKIVGDRRREREVAVAVMEEPASTLSNDSRIGDLPGRDIGPVERNQRSALRGLIHGAANQKVTAVDPGREIRHRVQGVARQSDEIR